jgi:hypothetical protein
MISGIKKNIIWIKTNFLLKTTIKIICNFPLNCLQDEHLEDTWYVVKTSYF